MHICHEYIGRFSTKGWVSGCQDARFRSIAPAGPAGKARTRSRKNLRLEPRIGAGVRRLPIAISSNVDAHHRQLSPRGCGAVLGEPAAGDPDTRMNDTPVARAGLLNIGRLREGAGGRWKHCVKPQSVNVTPSRCSPTHRRVGVGLRSAVESDQGARPLPLGGSGSQKVPKPAVRTVSTRTSASAMMREDGPRWRLPWAARVALFTQVPTPESVCRSSERTRYRKTSCRATSGPRTPVHVLPPVRPGTAGRRGRAYRVRRCVTRTRSARTDERIAPLVIADRGVSSGPGAQRWKAVVTPRASSSHARTRCCDRPAAGGADRFSHRARGHDFDSLEGGTPRPPAPSSRVRTRWSVCITANAPLGA